MREVEAPDEVPLRRVVDPPARVEPEREPLAREPLAVLRPELLRADVLRPAVERELVVRPEVLRPEVVRPDVFRAEVVRLGVLRLVVARELDLLRPLDAREVVRPAEPLALRAEARPPARPRVFAALRFAAVDGARLDDERLVDERLDEERLVVARPEVLRPELLRPDVLRPDVLRPPVARALVLRPDVLRPDVLRPDVLRPPVERALALRPDVLRLEELRVVEPLREPVELRDAVELREPEELLELEPLRDPAVLREPVVRAAAARFVPRPEPLERRVPADEVVLLLELLLVVERRAGARLGVDSGASSSLDVSRPASRVSGAHGSAVAAVPSSDASPIKLAAASASLSGDVHSSSERSISSAALGVSLDKFILLPRSPDRLRLPGRPALKRATTCSNGSAASRRPSPSWTTT